MDNESIWTQTLELIKEEISPANFRTWFSQTKIIEKEGEKIVIGAPSAFIQQQLASKFMENITINLEKVIDSKVSVDLKVDPTLALKKLPQTQKEKIEIDFYQPTIQPQAIGLNPKYTLENFVVGLSNNLAYAAAQAVIQNPGISYNPLFVYGGTGVGKTHLMHGVGHALYQKNSNLKIIYCSSEKFTNDFIESIQGKKTNEFRNKYRNCDLLLIDDIQFISGRDSTQEEFFHTFNELQSKNAQVILTSDRPPHEIQKLEGRLASRFQGGLMVDIQNPDFDTRVAIIRAKCKEKGEDIPEEAITLIAESMTTNARELEGKLIQIVQILKLSNQPFTQENIMNILGKTVVTSTPQKMDHKKVLLEVNQYFNLKMVDITGPRRKKELVLPRQLAMYLLYEECKLPYERIGEVLGGRDHTTILHGVEKIREACQRDREIQRMLIELKQACIN